MAKMVVVAMMIMMVIKVFASMVLLFDFLWMKASINLNLQSKFKVLSGLPPLRSQLSAIALPTSC